LQHSRPPEAPWGWPAHDPSRETFVFDLSRLVGKKPKAKAEGATTPETLRQKDRDRVMNFWKAKQQVLLPPKG
jgi:hypothetical protein